MFDWILNTLVKEVQKLQILLEIFKNAGDNFNCWLIPGGVKPLEEVMCSLSLVLLNKSQVLTKSMDVEILVVSTWN